MNDRIHPKGPRPLPASGQDEYGAANLRKPRGGVPVWVWVIIAVVLLLPVGCMGAGCLFYLVKQLAAEPPQKVPFATASAVTAPLPDER